MADKFQNILKQYWGYDDFRGIQREIIESISAGKDTLGLMPTGGGKSITFQVPAIAEEGTCLVITPLIALMKDQVQHLKLKGIKAAAVYSGMSRGEIVKTLENCIFGGIKLLYISPERLSSPLFLTKLKHINVSFITVDEAHCISQWGYDFRPSYLKIADLRKLKPEAPILALTATATLQVISDIQEKLNFHEKNVFRMSFERKNLIYVVRKTENKIPDIIHILNHVKGSAIIYTRNRRDCKVVSESLEASNISSTYYHAGLDQAVRDERQRAWQNDQKRVMVATNAFGMGIDKPDVRLVIHISSPDSIEAYFQEAGRAGRDGKRAYAILQWNGTSERTLKKRIKQRFPPKEYISNVYNHLAYYFGIGVGSGCGHSFTFELDKFSYIYKLSPILVYYSLQLLENSGYLKYETEPDSSARLMFLIGRNELYTLDTLNEKEERIIISLLRAYGGLFTDYEYIDLSLVAHMAGVGEQEVYLLLKSFNARHIVSFIPQRKKPYITYLRDRDTEIYIPPSVYEERREQYIKRIDAMISYATNDNVCRSQQLLRYFDEKDTKRCGHCDVCLEEKRRFLPKDDTNINKILSILADRKQHSIDEILDIDSSKTELKLALRFLVNEEKIKTDGFKISLL